MPRLHSFREKYGVLGALTGVSQQYVDPLDQPCCICGGEAYRRLITHFGKPVEFVEATAPAFDDECYSVFLNMSDEETTDFLSDYPIKS